MKSLLKSILITLLLSTLLSAKTDDNIQKELIQLKTSQDYAEKLTNEKITLIMGQIIQKEDELKELRNKLEESRLEKEKIKKDFGNYNEKIEWQNKRIEDLNLYLTLYGFLITALLFIASYLSYRFTSSNANKIVNNWIKENKKQILEPIKEEAKEFQQNIENEALKFYQKQLKGFKIDDKLDESQKQIQEETLKKVNELLDKKEKEEYSFDDWYSRYQTFYNQKKYSRALVFINKSLKHSSSEEEKSLSLFNKAYLLDIINDNKSIKESINTYNQLINEFIDSKNPNLMIRVSDALYNLGLTYSKIRQNEKAIEKYNILIEKFKETNIDSIQNCVLDAIANKMEIDLILKKKIENENEELYLELVKNEKQLIQFKMLKIFETSILKEVEKEISIWKEEFKNVSLGSWGFDELKNWANKFEDEEVKNRLLGYIDIFENHNKTIKED